MIEMAQALRAKNALRERLGRPEWLRGIGIRWEIGIGCYLRVGLREGPIEGLDELVPAEIDGVSTRVEVVGEIVAQQPNDSEARRVAAFIHEQWDFIPEEDAFEFYVGLGYCPISEGSVKISLWCLKRVLEHQA